MPQAWCVLVVLLWSAKDSSCVRAVRPKNSPALVWWHHLSVRIQASHTPGLTKIAAHTINNRMVFPFSTPHSHGFGTYFAPGAEESFYWHSVRMPSSGTMVAAMTKFHSHTVNFQEALALTATASELGLDLPAECFQVRPRTCNGAMNDPTNPHLRTATKLNGFDNPQVCGAVNATVTAASGLGSNAKLQADLLRRLEQLQLQSGHASKPRLICRIRGTRALVGGKLWGRRSLQFCDDWSFKAGDVLTTVGFHGPSHASAKELALQHLHWYMFYAPHGGRPQSSIAYADPCGYVHKRPNSHSWHRAPLPNRSLDDHEVN